MLHDQLLQASSCCLEFPTTEGWLSPRAGIQYKIFLSGVIFFRIFHYITGKETQTAATSKQNWLGCVYLRTLGCLEVKSKVLADLSPSVEATLDDSQMTFFSLWSHLGEKEESPPRVLQMETMVVWMTMAPIRSYIWTWILQSWTFWEELRGVALSEEFCYWGLALRL